MRLEGNIEIGKMGYIKMGYFNKSKGKCYPIPVSVVERVNSFLKFPEEKLTVLDPCCGEGLADSRGHLCLCIQDTWVCF